MGEARIVAYDSDPPAPVIIPDVAPFKAHIADLTYENTTLVAEVARLRSQLDQAKAGIMRMAAQRDAIKSVLEDESFTRRLQAAIDDV
jgi:regulator of replication initiation timing